MVSQKPPTGGQRLSPHPMGAASLECRVRRGPCTVSVHHLAAQCLPRRTHHLWRAKTQPEPSPSPFYQFSHLEGELLPVRAVHPGSILLELPALLRTHQSMGPEHLDLCRDARCFFASRQDENLLRPLVGGAQPPRLRDQVLPFAAHPAQTKGPARARCGVRRC